MGRPRDPPAPPPGEVIHARPSETARALCGLKPGLGRWSPDRHKVTCLPCQVEIGRRLITQRWRTR